MNLDRVLTVAAMHGRDLLRRRLARSIVILLPLVFYFSSELRPTDPAMDRLLAENPAERAAADLWLIATGTIGAGWAIAVAALFVMIGSRRFDQPLLLAGFRPTELLMGRVLTVLALSAVITPLFALVIRSQREIDLPLLTAATALSAVVAVTIGVLAAALVPREMEGVLVVIGVIGIQMSGDPQSWMPLWGASQLIRHAAGVTDAGTFGAALAHTAIYTVALLAVAVAVWARRVNVQPPARVLPTDATTPMGYVVTDGRTS
ncbi:MAG: hypothetical protein ACRDWI_06930 [Jiangellaceae bacterium]